MSDGKPMLGLATTRDMLKELRVRGEIGGSRPLEVQVGFLLRVLDEETLNYRTVDHG